MTLPRRTTNPTEKRPFDIGIAIRRLRQAVRPYPRAALFELAAEGYDSPFEILIACILSIRTRDETSLPTAKALLAHARTPAEMARLSVADIGRFIEPCTYYEAKAQQIHTIARQIVDEHDGTLPSDADVLMSFHGVGPKCANLALGIACGQPTISVDIHVYRVTNRWGYVAASTPEKTMAALQAKLPRRSWIEINALLVPFGKHICTGSSPKCSTCPLLDMCQQVGVTTHR
jgi:endonuclease-3